MKLALGTVQFGLPYGIANREGQVAPADILLMLSQAAASGLDTIDTAAAYGDSEVRLGEAGVGDFHVVTKLPPMPEGCVDICQWALDQAAASLERLKVPSVQGLLLHRPEMVLGVHGPELLRALSEIKERGLARQVGVSVYAPEELESLSRVFRFDLVQAPFNLVDRRLVSSGWLDRLKQAGVEVHVRSAFLQGLLLMEEESISPAFGRWAHLWKAWSRWRAETGWRALDACLALPLSTPGIDRVVVGADGPGQLAEILAAVGGSPEVFPAIACNDEDLINPARWGR